MQHNVPSKLRTLNKSLVLNTIMKKGPISRAQIAKETNLTRATSSHIVQELIEENFIIETGIKEGEIGRKGLLLSFNNNYGFIIGIDLGGTKISIGIFDYSSKLKYVETIKTFQVDNREIFIDKLIVTIKHVIKKSGRVMTDLKGIGVASPGIIDFDNGIVVEGSPNLPNWKNLFLRDILESAFKVPVIIDNDVRAALIGEFYKGKCQDVTSAVLVSLGTGIGSAMLIDGKVIRGATNAAGEIGYFLFERAHLTEDWGDKGCFETLASGSGMEIIATDADAQLGTTEDIFLAAENGNNVAIQIVTKFKEYLSIALINIVTMVNPEKIILTGGMSRAADMFLEDINENIKSHIFHSNMVEVEVTDLFEKAAIYGMSILTLTAIHPDIKFLDGVDILG